MIVYDFAAIHLELARIEEEKASARALADAQAACVSSAAALRDGQGMYPDIGDDDYLFWTGV